jgi:hypothetical protein
LLYMAMDKHASTANIEIVHQFQCKISFWTICKTPTKNLFEAGWQMGSVEWRTRGGPTAAIPVKIAPRAKFPIFHMST